MGLVRPVISTYLSTQTHAAVSDFIPNPGYNGKDKSFDLHTGEGFVEISAMNGKDSKVKRWTQMHIVCSQRASQPKEPFVRGKVLTNESMQTVQALKRANGDENKIQKVFQTRVSRLVKAELLTVLAELQRQDECDLALRVFEAVRKEVWYKSDFSLYFQMIKVLKRNNLFHKIEPIFSELKKEESLEADTKAFTHLQSIFLQMGMAQNAVETYQLMKQSGCKMDEYAFTFLIKGLQRLGEPDLAEAVKKEYAQFLDECKVLLEDIAE
eukprot:Gb_18843 [translate_table: standard]